jgi:TRAP-type C4-dicarboxylate transport system permease small subunit
MSLDFDEVSLEDAYSRYELVLQYVFYFSAVILLTLTVIVVGNIVLRPFGEAPRWVTHMAQIMVIWITFLGLGLLAYEREHLAVDILTDRYFGNRRYVHEKFELITSLVFTLLVLYSAIDLTNRTLGGTTATGVPTTLIYSPLIIGSVLLAVVYVGQLAGLAGDLDG